MKLKKKKGKKEYKQRDDVMPPAHHAHSDTQTHTDTCLNVYTKRKDSGITRDSENAHSHTYTKKKKTHTEEVRLIIIIIKQCRDKHQERVEEKKRGEKKKRHEQQGRSSRCVFSPMVMYIR